MSKTQVILLTSGSDELKEKIVTDGPIVLPGTPAVVLSLPPTIIAETGRVSLRQAVVESIDRRQSMHAV